MTFPYTLLELSAEGKELFEDKRDQILSILETSSSENNGLFLGRMIEQVKQIQIISESDYISTIGPNQIWSRDSLAISQGVQVPPHISVLAQIYSLQSPIQANDKLAKIAQKAATHISRITKGQTKIQMGGNRIFIGHGHSLVWKDLKDFIENRLKLLSDEFNRVPVAGKTNIDRLSEMLDSASFAFLIMTAEDEQPDGKLRARMNVIHEAGLFQGRLGFNKAIVLLEEGCEGFSNIDGLGQILFPKGNIKAAFEEIRKVLEREEILKS
jgi:predicted nucleotide-binding protein